MLILSILKSSSVYVGIVYRFYILHDDGNQIYFADLKNYPSANAHRIVQNDWWLRFTNVYNILSNSLSLYPVVCIIVDYNILKNLDF